VCKISAQYVHFYLGFYASQKKNFSVDVYVHLAATGVGVAQNTQLQYLPTIIDFGEL
jgi:hypothetical protein